MIYHNLKSYEKQNMNRNSMEEYTKEKMKAYKDLLFYTNVTKFSYLDKIYQKNMKKHIILIQVYKHMSGLMTTMQ